MLSCQEFLNIIQCKKYFSFKLAIDSFILHFHPELSHSDLSHHRLELKELIKECRSRVKTLIDELHEKGFIEKHSKTNWIIIKGKGFKKKDHIISKRKRNE